jgi:hypothetical protein
MAVWKLYPILRYAVTAAAQNVTGLTIVINNSLARQLFSGSLVVLVLAWACSISSDVTIQNTLSYSFRNIGVVPVPPEHAGRDAGFSGMLQGRSVWVFDDTFLPRPASDGLQWRSSSWSWTKDTSSEDGIGPFHHALDEEGLAIQLLPHTSKEAAFNIAHVCGGREWGTQGCGSRLTPWPHSIVVDHGGQKGVIYYNNMQIGPGGQWDFRVISGSVATWSDPELPAERVEPPLFSDEEPDWGSAAVLVDKDIYVYACEFNGKSKPCLLARVPFDSATEKQHYRYWAGKGEWSKDWRDAIPIFEGGSIFSVHYNAYLKKFLAFYMPGLTNEIVFRTTDLPQGPWSDPYNVGKGLPASENWDYALNAHPEFSRENGRIEILSYIRPVGFLRQDTQLIELRFD